MGNVLLDIEDYFNTKRSFKRHIQHDIKCSAKRHLVAFDRNFSLHLRHRRHRRHRHRHRHRRHRRRLPVWQLAILLSG